MIILSNFKRIAQNCQGQIDGASANFRLCADEPAAGVAELAALAYLKQMEAQNNG